MKEGQSFFLHCNNYFLDKRKHFGHKFGENLRSRSVDREVRGTKGKYMDERTFHETGEKHVFAL